MPLVFFSKYQKYPSLFFIIPQIPSLKLRLFHPGFDDSESNVSIQIRFDLVLPMQGYCHWSVFRWNFRGRHHVKLYWRSFHVIQPLVGADIESAGLIFFQQPLLDFFDVLLCGWEWASLWEWGWFNSVLTGALLLFRFHNCLR